MLEDLHTKVQGMITSPHLYTTLLYDVFRRWSLYLNKCMGVSSSEVLVATRSMVPFFIKIILLYFESR